jgi:DMSO reductase anchor subunit
MHPAFSVISFTTLLGAAQGLVVALAVLKLLGQSVPHMVAMLVIATALLIISLGASFFHLGHPERAWRAAAMWRTSWLSREVIVLPLFIGLVVLWAFLEWRGLPSAWILVPVIAVSAGLWVCTAMIYACIKFIQEWAHPITIVNYLVLGLGSGVVLLLALLALVGAPAELIHAVAPWAVGLTAVGLVTRAVSIQRNARLKPKSTLQSATGISNPVIQQKSMGMSAGAFNTREFFHGKSEFFVRNVKSIMWGLCFVLPLLLVILATTTHWHLLLVLAFLVQYLGLLSERWLFFAQARHPQNLYYQTVS